LQATRNGTSSRGLGSVLCQGSEGFGSIAFILTRLQRRLIPSYLLVLKSETSFQVSNTRAIWKLSNPKIVTLAIRVIVLYFQSSIMIVVVYLLLFHSNRNDPWGPTSMRTSKLSRDNLGMEDLTSADVYEV
jgi:hypothetical protein